jgi:hypothetical protein
VEMRKALGFRLKEKKKASEREILMWEPLA